MPGSDTSKFPTPETFKPFAPRRNVKAGLTREQFIKLTDERKFRNSPMAIEMNREQEKIEKAKRLEGALNPMPTPTPATSRFNTQISILDELDGTTGVAAEPILGPLEDPMYHVAMHSANLIDHAADEYVAAKEAAGGMTVKAFQILAKKSAAAAAELANAEKPSELATLLLPETLGLFAITAAIYRYVLQADSEGRPDAAKTLP